MLKLWEPFFAERTNGINSTKRHFDAFSHNLENAFGNLFNSGIDWHQSDSGELMVWVDVPGIKEEDLNIELLDGQISIKGQRKTNNSSYSVYKSFPVPQGYKTDDIKAELKDGVLNVQLIKSEEISEKEPKKIAISTAK